MSKPRDESITLREKWLPQASMRFFLLLIAGSATGMFIFRTAILSDLLWAKVAALIIATAGACFVVYALLFLLAAAVSFPVASPAMLATQKARGRDDSDGDSQPSGSQPSDFQPSEAG